MEVQSLSASFASVACDALVLGITDQWSQDPEIAQWNSATQNWLKKHIESEEILTKPLKATVIVGPPGLAARTLITVGLGDRSCLDAGLAFRAAATGAKLAASKKRPVVAFAGISGGALQNRSAVAGGIVGGVGQDLYRREKNLFAPEKLCWLGVDDESCQQGKVIGESVNLTRRLINLPPNQMYPESFAEEAMSVAQSTGLSIEVWDQARLTQERCGALLAVGQGSSHESRLVKLTYSPPDSQSNSHVQPIAMVGKGVTFDSGGLSIKPTESMLTMKGDMAGAATVLGVMQAIAHLKPPVPVVGLMGLAENMISGDSFKLGDVLTSRSGKTIEIHNTDAEGRLVLADVLTVACELQPKCIIDFATLTGACVVALGNDVAGLMTNNETWQREISDTANRCGEYVWPLPMFPFFAEQIAGKVADIKNVGEGRWGGAITAAKFLEEFVEGKPWTHVDLAGPAFHDNPKPWCDAGGSGFLVRTMIELLMSQ